MNRFNVILCLFGVFSSVFVNNAESTTFAPDSNGIFGPSMVKNSNARREEIKKASDRMFIVRGLDSGHNLHATWDILYFSSLVSALESEGIIGGDYADDAQFKYQISLQVLGFSLCGGAIIADNYVLTAAHCVIDNEADGAPFRNYPFKVVAGTVDLNTKEGKPVAVAVEKIYVHRGYNPPETHNDIAVLKLKGSLGINKNSYLDKINLPTSQNTYNGKVATISGYGWQSIKTKINPLTGQKIELGGDTDNKLKYAQVKIIDNQKCRQLSYPQNVVSSQICGHVVQHGGKHEGICSGDSGGPLVYGDTIIGIVSTSPPGCEEHVRPAVYTRVSSFDKFVRSIMSGNPTADARVHTVGAATRPRFT